LRYDGAIYAELLERNAGFDRAGTRLGEDAAGRHGASLRAMLVCLRRATSQAS
jgi:hypothetical protein